MSSTGFDFTPFVIEAHSGSLSSAARKVVDMIAKAQEQIGGRFVSEPTSLRIAQRISVALHRENARAILKRSVETPRTTASTSWADYREEGLG